MIGAWCRVEGAGRGYAEVTVFIVAVAGPQERRWRLTTENALGVVQWGRPMLAFVGLVGKIAKTAPYGAVLAVGRRSRAGHWV